MKENQPAISVIIPVYNTEQYVGECLDSVLAQTFSNFEIIAVNDGSTDTSLSVLQTYASKDSRIKVIDQANSGQAAARNAGLELSKGKYVFFLDSDDLLTADAFEKLCLNASATDADIIVYDYYLLDNRTGELSYFRDEELYERLNGLTFTIDEAPELMEFVGVCDRIFKREFLEENSFRFPEGRLYEDHIFCIETELLAKKISLISDHIYYYRRYVEGSTTFVEKGSEKHRSDFLYVQQCAQMELEKAQATDEMWRYYSKYFLGYAYMHQRHAKAHKEFREFFKKIRSMACPKLTSCATYVTHSQVIFYKKCLQKNKPEIASAYMLAVNAAHVPYDMLRNSRKRKKFLELGMIDKQGNRLSFLEKPQKFLPEFKGTSPVVSVLIPCYNVEEYIHECLDSVLAQDFKEFEAICINDGSTDSTPEIIKSYCEKDARFKLIDKQNSGYGASMNRGLDEARGKYVAILESDDFMEPNTLSSLVSEAENYKADAVKANFFSYWSTPKCKREKNNIVLPEYPHVATPATFHELFWCMPSIWSGIYSREFLRKNNIRFLETAGASYQDVSFSFKVWACAGNVVLMNDAFVNYRSDNENSSVNSSSKVFCICDEFEEIEKFLDETNKASNLKKIEVRFKFDCYIWNFKRLGPEARREFLPRFYEEFLQEKTLGNIDYLMFWPWNEVDCKLLLRDPIKFLEESNKANCEYSSAKQVLRYLKAGGPKLLKRRTNLS